MKSIFHDFHEKNKREKYRNIILKTEKKENCFKNKELLK